MRIRTSMLIGFLFFGFALATCGTVKELAYDYPDDIKDADKKEFSKQFAKGKVLYEMNCGKCHNKSVDGKTVIPDFSLPQLMDYEVRIQYPEHQDDLKETNITADELDWIVIFLRYKKRSNVPYNK